jgi:hypothetical protein
MTLLVATIVLLLASGALALWYGAASALGGRAQAARLRSAAERVGEANIRKNVQVGMRRALEGAKYLGLSCDGVDSGPLDAAARSRKGGRLKPDAPTK